MIADNKISLKAGRCHVAGCFKQLDPEPIIIEIKGIKIWTLLCKDHKKQMEE